ncbi:MAG: ribonuclease Z [Bacteroidaceae bacterium]|nr:ribonuclease Z [Bacteroidaceae bacterium]
MAKFEITMLGCGSGIPTAKHMTSAQIVNINERLFLVDCGEGTQTQIWKYRVKLTNLDAIFISHMHGDHFFGLIPLLSSIGLMLARTEDLHIYMPIVMVEPIQYDLDKYCYLPYKVILHGIDTTAREVLYENSTMTVESIPLEHKTPCMGFLFKEKPKANILLPEKCKEYGINCTEFRKIKEGADYITPDGRTIPNSELTKPSDYIPKSYAYCSDTSYCPALAEQIHGVDLLYHEATFVESEKDMAATAGHSTASQAADIALRANAKQLAIGHYSIRYNDEDELLAEAKSVFSNTVATQEGMVISI